MHYRENETMKLIGHQVFYEGCETPEQEELLRNQVTDIVKANEPNADNLKYGFSSYVFSICMDAFLLGTIYGKRTERRKKHRRARD